MRYRLYRPSDFAALYAIEEECFQPPIRFGRQLMRSLIRNPHSATWIAETGIAESDLAEAATNQQNTPIAGFAIVDFTVEPEGTVAYIETIEISAAYRRRGIATRLLDCVQTSACQVGAVAIWLHVDTTNAAAIRLYRENGFVQQGRHNHYYARGRAADIYVKPLPDPSAQPPQ